LSVTPPVAVCRCSKPALKTVQATFNARATGGKAGTAELQALEQRLVRLEQLVLLIAQQVGVPPDAITRLLPPAAPPT
jgi:hypothetical protein